MVSKASNKPASEAAGKLNTVSATPTLREVENIEPDAIERSLDPVDIRRMFENGEYPYAEKIKTSQYESRKAELQVELLKAQDWIKATNRRLFSFSKAGMQPARGARSSALWSTSIRVAPGWSRSTNLQNASNTQWYFQRYISHLPAGGEMVLFDRSWYNRGGVERVMNFCTPNDYLEFMREAPELERMMVRSGILLFKYWFSVTREEQKQRFEVARNRAPQALETLTH